MANAIAQIEASGQAEKYANQLTRFRAELKSIEPAAVAFHAPDGPTAIAGSMPIAAVMAVKPDRTAYGKIWDTDVAAIERCRFVDRPWISRALFIVQEYRLPAEIGDGSLVKIVLAIGRLWYEGRGVCHHSYSYIAERANVCRSRCVLAIKWLRAHGLLIGMNVLVRKNGLGDEKEYLANVYLPKTPEEGPAELGLPLPETPAAHVTMIERIKAELRFIAGRCRDAIVTSWGINIRGTDRRKGQRAPA